jgi:hypothetical protein
MSGQRSLWRETVVWIGMLGTFVVIATLLVLGLRSVGR